VLRLEQCVKVSTDVQKFDIGAFNQNLQSTSDLVTIEQKILHERVQAFLTTPPGQLPSNC